MIVAEKHYKLVGECLNVRGRSPERKENGNKGRNHSRSKSISKKNLLDFQERRTFQKKFPKEKVIKNLIKTRLLTPQICWKGTI